MELGKLLVISLILGLVVAFGISFAVGAEDVVKQLSSVEYSFIALALVFQFLALFASSLRWKIVTDKAGIKLSHKKAFMINLAGMAIGNVTPSARMAGEPLRAYLLNKETKSSTKLSLATIITERLFDGVTFTVMTFFITLLAVTELKLPNWILSALVIAFACSVITIVLMTIVSVDRVTTRNLSSWLLKRAGWLTRRFPNLKNLEKKMLEDSDVYAVNAKHLMKQQDLWLYGIVLTVLVWVFDVFRTYFVFQALGITVPFTVILAAITISALMGSIPVFPGGIGLMETTMIIIYSSSGINLAIAGTSTIIDRLISFWTFTFIGLACAYYLGIKHYKGDKK